MGWLHLLRPANEVWGKVMFYTSLSFHRGGLCPWCHFLFLVPCSFWGGSVHDITCCLWSRVLSGGEDLCQEGVCNRRPPHIVDEWVVCILLNAVLCLYYVCKLGRSYEFLLNCQDKYFRVIFNEHIGGKSEKFKGTNMNSFTTAFFSRIFLCQENMNC